MMDVNSGYIGYSMSRRAAEAYEDGEMPKSKWTKKAMVAAIKDACDELDLEYDPAIEKMKKVELFDTFLYNSSWHHTSKFFNETVCTASMRPNRAASTGQSSVTSYTTRGMLVTTLSPSREKPQP